MDHRDELVTQFVLGMAGLASDTYALNDTLIRDINHFMRRLAKHLAVPAFAVRGAILHRCGSGPEPCAAAAERKVVQAAFVGQYGVGVLLWDGAAFEAAEAGTISSDASVEFKPYEEVPTDIQALLVPQVGPLLESVVLNGR